MSTDKIRLLKRFYLYYSMNVDANKFGILYCVMEMFHYETINTNEAAFLLDFFTDRCTLSEDQVKDNINWIDTQIKKLNDDSTN